MFSSVCFLPQSVSFNLFSICFLQYVFFSMFPSSICFPQYVFNMLPFVSGMWFNVQSRWLNFVQVTSSCIYLYSTSSFFSLYSTSSCISHQQLYISISHQQLYISPAAVYLCIPPAAVYL